MAKRKLSKSPELENQNAALVQQPVQDGQESLDQDVSVKSENVEGRQTLSHAILGMGQTYGNRYVRNLIEARGNVDKQTQDRIESQRGSGRPLDGGLRTEMEKSFNRDLGEVRLHTGGEAAGLAGELNAGAFTTGKDIFFADNAYQPGTGQGLRTLRHELAHVVQQVNDMGVMPSILTRPGDIVERDAVAAESSESWAPASNLPAGVIARNPPRTTPEAPSANQAPPSSSAPSASSSQPQSANPTGDDANRRQALIGMWNGMVVNPVNSAHEAVSTGQFDADKAATAMGHVSTSMNGIKSMMESYRDKPEFYTALQRDFNALWGIEQLLGHFAGSELNPARVVNGLAILKGRLPTMSADL